MEQDAVETLSTLESRRKEQLELLVAQRQGRIFKTAKKAEERPRTDPRAG